MIKGKIMDEILIVEDEIKLRQELKVFLNNNGFKTKEIIDFDDTLKQMLCFGGDLILLDVNLPNVNGEFLCREYRKIANKPIIIVTSRNSELDELMCINYGADDFVTKPYNPLILLARIEAVLKRANPKEELIINYQDICLDVSKSSIIKNNQVVDLSKNELKISFKSPKPPANGPPVSKPAFFRPSSPYLSYVARLLSSIKVSYAFPSSLNFSSASGALFTSGCNVRAFFLKADFISSFEASLETSNIS